MESAAGAGLLPDKNWDAAAELSILEIKGSIFLGESDRSIVHP